MTFCMQVLKYLYGVLLWCYRRMARKKQDITGKTDPLLKEIVESLMAEEKPYLNQRYTIAAMAEQTGMQLQQLSAFINQHYKMSYTEFINRHRIEYCRHNLINDERWQSLKLQTIAEECGFSSRNTFTLAFKKFIGVTPVEFIRLLKKKPITTYDDIYLFSGRYFPYEACRHSHSTGP
jgi:AraC-like DNA-binding protein